jgi:two-component system, OmpR family, sensor histidine kinase MtrB
MSLDAIDEQPPAGPTRREISHGPRIGLRVRIALGVAAVGLVLSVVLSVTALAVTQDTLVDTREATLTRRLQANSETIRGQLDDLTPEALQPLLTSLPDGGAPSLYVKNESGSGFPVSVDPRIGPDALPRELVDSVVDRGETAIMRFSSRYGVFTAAGVPLGDTGLSYFEAIALDDVDNAVRNLRIGLLAATGLATVLAVGLGFWASKYALRPLKRIGEAAESVAMGQLDTRIDYRAYESDPDLAPLVANFNGMVSALQDRIDRDARFASDVSHELRSPLTTLNASIEVLLNNRDELPDRPRQALDLLSLDMRRFTQLVEDLLEISRFDAGAVRLELDSVPLVSTVRAAVRATSEDAVPVDADPDVEDLVVSCDKRRLMRILANFLDNARKYADGATSVIVERHDPGESDLVVGPSVRIAVEDSGPGVPEAERSRIFDRFNRGDQGGSRGTDMGVGLGLALAAEHARLQGGRVWVEDRHDGGQGARFVVELPLLGGEPETVEDPYADLAAITPEEAESLALTGELPAIRIEGRADEPAERPELGAERT